MSPESQAPHRMESINISKCTRSVFIIFSSAPVLQSSGIHFLRSQEARIRLNNNKGSFSKTSGWIKPKILGQLKFGPEKSTTSLGWKWMNFGDTSYFWHIKFGESFPRSKWSVGNTATSDVIDSSHITQIASHQYVPNTATRVQVEFEKNMQGCPTQNNHGKKNIRSPPGKHTSAR